MKLQERIRRCIRHSRLILFVRLLCDAVYEAYNQSLHLGASRMMDDEVKYAADLQIRTHAIEKGLSIGSCRAGFGIPKVESLLEDLSLYITRFPHAHIDEAIAVIDKYINFNRAYKIDISHIEEQYERLLSVYKLRQEVEAGIKTCSREDTFAALQSSFDVFSASRYSVRDFDNNGSVAVDSIIEAINIARKAPSACNRQPALAHIFSGDKAQALFDFQGGCKGFSRDMRYAILITADMRRYFIQERHQMYVDGGLFAMDLLLSLHYKGLATIPLTTAFKSAVVRKMLLQFDIPSHEVPIMLIGVGAYKEEYKVAISHRNPVEEYCRKHD
ncbi:MAG: nitroreductase family protein [Bacteroidaceae bacterium]|nr:nitroreductase family protein [Bacteroidaceae bacterium]